MCVKSCQVIILPFDLSRGTLEVRPTVSGIYFYITYKIHLDVEKDCDFFTLISYELYEINL